MMSLRERYKRSRLIAKPSSVIHCLLFIVIALYGKGCCLSKLFQIVDGSILSQSLIPFCLFSKDCYTYFTDFWYNVVHEEESMCQTTAYVIEDDREVMLFQDVISIRPENGALRMVNLFGEEKIIPGKIKQIDLLAHKILIAN